MKRPFVWMQQCMEMLQDLSITGIHLMPSPYQFFVENYAFVIQDYGIDFNDCDHPVKAFQCLCGSQNCRGSNR
ncbi:histone-lysine n-methyltransferase suvr4 [Quercus suber]|uniref:Histone-lysine n-methyltransferase suvr4 n=1 Tax=Quercus suber TaxID=58331 RepID=A0AAW0JDF9_QUESU